MKAQEIMAIIRRLDSEIIADEKLVEALIDQTKRKQRQRDQLRSELKVAFAREHQIKQPSAKHADIYQD